MYRSSDPVDRDDCGVPLFSTYWPERARIDTDTVNVHPTVTPVTNKLILFPNPRTRPSTMQRSSDPVERDNCGVPLFSTYWPERAQIDTDTVNVHPTITLVTNKKHLVQLEWKISLWLLWDNIIIR